MYSIVIIIYLLNIILMSTAQQIQHEFESNYAKCVQSNQTCFGYPDHCVINKNCEILLTALPLNDLNKTVEFQILGIPNSPNDSYLAMSLGQSFSMGGSVTICALGNHSNVFLRNGVNEGYKSSRPLGHIDGIELLESDFSDGLLRCKWHRNSVTRVNGVEYNIANTSYYLHVAKGVWDETRDYITHHTLRLWSEDKYDLQTLPQNSPSTTASLTPTSTTVKL